MDRPETMKDLIAQVQDWGRERGLHKTDPLVQYTKLVEEVAELGAAIVAEDYIEQEDAVGDILVVLTNLCMELDISDIEDCYWAAYQEIKDRKGVTLNGKFIKEEDLR